MAGNILLQNLRVFTKDLSDNDLMLFKIDKRVDMPAKEDMGVTYASFMGQLQLDRFVKKAGDIMSGDLVHINNKGIFATTVDGTTRSVFKMDNTNTLLVGSLSTPLKIQSSIDPKVSVAGTESVIYHSGNSNKSTISWAANTLTVAGMANFNGSSWFHGALVKNSPSKLKNMSIEVTDLGVVNFKINNAYTGLVLDSNDQTAKFPNKIFALNNKEVLHTGNFQTLLDSVYVLKTQTVNNKPLTGNIALTWADVGALSADADGKTVTDNLIIKNGKRVQAKTTKDEYADIFTVTVYDTLEVGSSKMTTRIFSDVNPQVSVGGNRGDLYSTLNKPSASDVGLGLVGNYQAVNKAGDEIAGSLKMTGLGLLYPAMVGNAARGIRYLNSTGKYAGQFGMEWDSENSPIAKCFYIGHGGDPWVNNTWFKAEPNGLLTANSGNRIYHQGFKPTTDELGLGKSVCLGFINQKPNDSESKYLKIATLKLPQSASTAYVTVYGGNGFNANTYEQAGKSEIIIRTGNAIPALPQAINIQCFNYASLSVVGSVFAVNTSGAMYDLYVRPSGSGGIYITGSFIEANCSSNAEVILLQEVSTYTTPPSGSFVGLVKMVAGQGTSGTFGQTAHFAVTPPLPWIAYAGQVFDKVSYPRLALLYPSGIMPDYRDRYIKSAGTESVGTTNGGAVPAHTHAWSGTTSSFDYGTKSGTTSVVGNHVHSAWTDTQGAHVHGFLIRGGWSDGVPSNAAGRNGSTGDATAQTAGAGAHGHNIGVGGAGEHTHTVGIGIGAHTHTVSGTTSAYGSGGSVETDRVALILAIYAE